MNRLNCFDFSIGKSYKQCYLANIATKSRSKLCDVTLDVHDLDLIKMNLIFISRF